jgi:membrane associated rhomboid family serine protease
MNPFVREAKLRLAVPLAFTGAIWLVAMANAVTNDSLAVFGIRPRTLEGLWGILFAPFLHGNLLHLVTNTIPLVVLGCLVALRGRQEFFFVTGWVMVVGGGAVWLLGRPFSIHIGASGVVFGYLGFLLARGVFERSFQASLLAVVVFIVYGGALWGVLPSSSRISWESHLFGVLAGVIAAKLLSRPPSSERT